ncbi:cytokine receptor family member b4 [Betta splendens]|uniref:Cytokine receptor family member b4 n=1 Tax=Betta splendens TaxID=158456 RepID=A0A6P7LFU3_BETSP|nr:cytokine receptor family member b4 [Betta splendens]
MSAAVWVFFLALAAPCGSEVVPPSGVNLTSYNLDLVLRWLPPVGLDGDVRYTAEYRSSTGNYSSGCVNISAVECDLTRLQSKPETAIFEYGKYTGRVQAHLGSETSAWVESRPLSLDQETTIGPPTVNLTSGHTIEVSIKNPVLAISSLIKTYSTVTYNIMYWEDGQKEKAKSISHSRQNRVVLDDLKPSTVYCVQVQINTYYSEPSEQSRPVCERTFDEVEPQWVTAVLTFIGIAVAMALVVVTVLHRRSISNFLCPRDVLPEHIKKYLLTPPSSSIYLEMQKPPLLEENYDPISIIAEEKTVEVPEMTCSTRTDIAARDR